MTRVAEFEGGLLLCCDIRHRILRTESALEVFSNIAAIDPLNYKSVAFKELIGQCVLTRYNNNLYTIDDIDWDRTPLSTFKLSTGTDITFLDYYKRQYNIDIIDLEQPLLVSKTKIKNEKGEFKFMYLVPEICHMTGLTEKMKNDVKVMKEISAYTRITPYQRNYAFNRFLRNIKNNDDAKEMLLEWGLNIDVKPLEIEAQILPREFIIFKDVKKMEAPSNGFWLSCIKNFGAFRTVRVNSWILFHTLKDKNLAYKFKEMILKVGPGLGMKISNPQMVALKNDKIESYIQGLRDNVNSETQVILT